MMKQYTLEITTDTNLLVWKFAKVHAYSNQDRSMAYLWSTFGKHGKCHYGPICYDGGLLLLSYIY